MKFFKEYLGSAQVGFRAATRGYWWFRFEKIELKFNEYLTNTLYGVKILGVKFLIWHHLFGEATKEQVKQALKKLDNKNDN